MLQTRALKQGDKDLAFNETKKEWINVSIVEYKETSEFEIMQGYERLYYNIKLKCNGDAKGVEQNDKITFMGRTYLVEKTYDKPSAKLSHFRADYDSFPSTTIIYLRAIEKPVVEE